MTLFYSFLAQIEANRLQLRANGLIQSQWQFDSYTKIFNDIQSEISNLKYTFDESEALLARICNPPSKISSGKIVYSEEQIHF